MDMKKQLHQLSIGVLTGSLLLSGLAFAEPPDNGGGTSEGGGGFVDDVTGVYEDGKEIFEDGKKFYDENRELITGIYSFGQDAYNLVSDFSVTGLLGFACQAGRTVDKIEGEQEDVPEGEEPVQDQPSDEADTVCDIASTFENIKETLEETDTTVFAQAEGIFGSLVGSGLVKVSKGDRAAYTAALELLDTAVKDGDLTEIKDKGEALLKLWADTESGPGADGSKEAELDRIGGPAYAATKSLTTGDEYLAKQTQLNSVTSRVASEQFADELVDLASATGEFNEEFTKPDDGVAANRRVDSQGAVSTRATAQVVLEAIADLQMQIGTNSQKVLETTVIQAQQSVLTNQQLSTIVELESQQLQVQKQSALALERLELAQNQKLANDVGGTFGFATATFEAAATRYSDGN